MAILKTDEKELEVNDGEKIMSPCQKLNVPFGCTQGICGTCKIKIIEGIENLSDLSNNEKEMTLDKDIRLACQCSIKSGEVKFEIVNK